MKITAKTGLLIEGVGLFHIANEWENLRKYVSINDRNVSFIAQVETDLIPMLGFKTFFEDEVIHIISASSRTISEQIRLAHRRESQPIRTFYDDLVTSKFEEYSEAGFEDDKASRMANKYAVQNTWRLYHDYSISKC